MITNLPITEAPDWLMNANSEKPHSLPPIKELLKNSLFYPSSGFDGTPIAHLSGNFYSFIYVDYGYNSTELDNNLLNSGFLGYEAILSIDVNEKELSPNGWTPREATVNNGNPNKYQSWIKKPFAKWIVFQRHTDLDDNHGAERFSLLYICAEGLSTFQALYLSNNCVPLAVAIIRPGTGFGCNWTDFTEQEMIFARTVLENPQGKPKYLINDASKLLESCWPAYYPNRICLLKDTLIEIWKNT